MECENAMSREEEYCMVYIKPLLLQYKFLKIFHRNFLIQNVVIISRGDGLKSYQKVLTKQLTFHIESYSNPRSYCTQECNYKRKVSRVSYPFDLRHFMLLKTQRFSTCQGNSEFAFLFINFILQFNLPMKNLIIDFNELKKIVSTPFL